MDETARGLTLMAESYPELKSSENFKTLQLAVMDTEEHLQAARRLYNGNVAAYNERLVTFPSSLAAAFAKAEAAPVFPGGRRAERRCENAILTLRITIWERKSKPMTNDAFMRLNLMRVRVLLLWGGGAGAAGLRGPLLYRRTGRTDASVFCRCGHFSFFRGSDACPSP